MSGDFKAGTFGREFLKSTNRDRITGTQGPRLYRSVILTANRFGACDWTLGRPQGNTDPISGTRYSKLRVTTEWTNHTHPTFGPTGNGRRIDELTNDGFSRYWTASMVVADAPYNNASQVPINPFSRITGSSDSVFTVVSKTKTTHTYSYLTATSELLDADPSFGDLLMTEARAAFNSSNVRNFESVSTLLADPFGGGQYYDHATRVQWAMGPGLPIIDSFGVRSSYAFNESNALRKIATVVGNSAGGASFGVGDPNSALNFFIAASASKACLARQIPAGLPPPDIFLANSGRVGQFTINFPLWEVVLQRVQVYTTTSNRWIFSVPTIYDYPVVSFSRSQVDCRVNAPIPNSSLEPPESAMVADYGKTYFSKCYPPMPNYLGTDSPSCFTVPASS